MLGTGVACAEGFDFGALNGLSDAAGGFDAAGFARSLVSGEMPIGPDAIRTLMSSLMDQIREACLGLARRLAVPILGCALTELVLGRTRRARQIVELACVACCALTLVEFFRVGREVASRLMGDMSRASEVLAPVAASVAALSGAAGSAAMTPLAAQCAGIAEEILASIGMALCSAGAAVAVAGNLSERFSLDKLFTAIRTGAHWMLGLMMFACTGVMSMQGLMRASLDSAAARTAGAAIERLIPIIGGEISETTGTLAATAGVVRSALGVTGAVLIARVCLEPLARLGASVFALKLAAGVAEPFAGRSVAGMLDQFGDVMELMLAMGAASAALVWILTGGCLAMAGGIFR